MHTAAARRIALAALLLAAITTACNFQVRTPPGGSLLGESGSADAASTDFPVAVDGPLQVLSQYGELAGVDGKELCAWSRTYARRAHLGGGHYADMVVPASTDSGPESNWVLREDPVGPCAELASKAKSDSDMLASARKTAQCGSKCVHGARWLDDEWVVHHGRGGPTKMTRVGEVLSVVREAGVVKAPSIGEAVLTSDKMKTAIAHVCNFPAGPGPRVPCVVKSAKVQRKARFWDSQPTVADVFVDVNVEIEGQPGVCEMRVSNVNDAEVGEAQCRASTSNLPFGTWDVRCFTNLCVQKTAELRGH